MSTDVKVVIQKIQLRELVLKKYVKQKDCQAIAYRECEVLDRFKREELQEGEYKEE